MLYLYSPYLLFYPSPTLLPYHLLSFVYRYPRLGLTDGARIRPTTFWASKADLLALAATGLLLLGGLG